MAFNQKGEFAFDNADQADRPTFASPAELKANLDSRANELRTHINDELVAVLNATTDGDSGADNIGATSIPGISGATVQEILEGIVAGGSGSIPPDGSISDAKLATDVKVGSLATLTTTEKGSVTGALNEVDGDLGTHVADSTLHLSTLTTEGDIVYKSAIDPARLGIGSQGTVLKSNGTIPSWAKELNYAEDSGSTDAYAVTISPAPTSYYTGMVVAFKANTANTGACTLNVNSLGDIAIKKGVSNDLADNDILANQIVMAVYDGTNFQLIDNPKSTNLQVFTSSGTWTKPTGVNWVTVDIISGGAGGKAGNLATRNGAGGGGRFIGTFSADVFDSSEAVVVGAGGTYAEYGNAGGNSSVDTLNGTLVVYGASALDTSAAGVGGGLSKSSVSSGGDATGFRGAYSGSAEFGGAAGRIGSGYSSLFGCGAGGSGGNSSNPGADGGSSNSYTAGGGGAGGVGVTGGNGADGAAGNLTFCGSGGGGGGGSTSAGSGNGGAGGIPGGGGGSGGQSDVGSHGHGGNGGRGEVRIYAW